jgi:transcriptional regulator with XRE-family HTH domain
MAKKKPKPTMTEALKAAIEKSGVSRYRIAKETGITEPSLSQFMQGAASLRLDKADVLAAYLGLQLVPDPDAKPPEPTPANRARPMLVKRRAKTASRRKGQ